MECLYVLYDDHCGLCRAVKKWAQAQPTFVPLVFVAAGSDRANEIYPGLGDSGEPEELVVVSDEGHVYRHDGAWIMCLYALVETREWSLRLASPMLRPLAKQAFTAISHGRGTVSRWLGLDDYETALDLKKVTLPLYCDLEVAASPLQRVRELVTGAITDDSDAPNKRRFPLS